MKISHNQLALTLKGLVYGRRGEPYRIRGHTLRYLPGTRPVRLRYVSSQDWVSRYDALQVKLLSTSLAEGDTFIDIGAHCGQYSILAAAICGQTGRVVAFEPDPHARERLLHNLTLNPDIKRPIIEPSALSDGAGEGVLYSRGGNSQSSLARSGLGSPARKSEEIPITLTTLDSYLLDKNLPTPHWVKIDVEGAEIRVLKGAEGVLSSNAGVLCELHPYAWAEFGNNLSELKDLAAASGRSIRYLDQDAEIGDSAEYGVVVLERLL